MDYDILRKNTLFAGLSREEIDSALVFFSAKTHFYKKGDTLHHAGDALSSFGLMLSGCIQVYSDDIDGHQMMMASVSPGDSFGEALCFLKVKESPVYIMATQDALVMLLSCEKLYEKCENDEALAIKNRFMALLASRALAMNSRIQTLSKHSLRQKLITFFTPYVRQYGNKPFSLPFDRQNMAIYLGTDRSALSRELAKMQSEGVIEYKRNVFRFLIISDEFDA